MLLQFTVENVLSFRDETVFSLLAAPGVEHAPGQVIEVPGLGRSVLRVAALYGANASGKSNLVKAMKTAALLVLVGTPPGMPINVSPFKLDPEAERKPRRFEFEIWADGARWSYGFACTSARVEAEWLYRDAGSGEEHVFQRTAGDDEVSIEIGNALGLNDERRQFWKFVAEGTRPTQLFLTEARERNVKELAALLQFFWNLFGFVRRTPFVLSERDDVVSFAAELLRGAGTGIAGLVVRDPKKDRPARGEIKGLGTAAEYIETDTDPKIRFLHSIPGGSEGIFLEEEEESDGTRRLVDLAPNWFLLEKTDATIVIDELDRSLHALLSRNLLERFLAADPVTSGQLVFTTHDTNLLDLELLPPDSIWFVEKDLGGGSSLYSLAEFKPEQLEQLGNKVESGYLHGRFGGTPFLSNPRISGSGSTKKSAS